jgi:hypothetical protein
MAITDEIEVDVSEFNKVKNAPDAIKEHQDYRRKELKTNSLMTPERYGSESLGYAVTKHTSPKSSKSYYYKSPLTGVKGMGIVEPKKFYERNEHKDPSHPSWKDPQWVSQIKCVGMRNLIVLYMHGRLEGNIGSRSSCKDFICFASFNSIR